MSNHMKKYLDSKTLLLYQDSVELPEEKNEENSFLSNSSKPF